ncbi:ABC transporter permease [candidate division KSB1 bacterium]|nr:ABC transporter permease [candidate division KSB1 bacterium]
MKSRILFLQKIMTDYGMLGVLILLCAYFSWATLQEQQPQGEDAAKLVTHSIHAFVHPPANILIATKDQEQDRAFASEVQNALQDTGFVILNRLAGTPAEIRAALETQVNGEEAIAAIVTTPDFQHTIQAIQSRIAALSTAQIIVPQSYKWPTFLLRENLINVVNQIVVFAIIAIGMTMVIITAGIDLSVGSLVALSAVIATSFIANNGGANAGASTMFLGALFAIVLCGLVGGMSGFVITRFNIPPFIATLGWMLVASGLAFIFASGESIYNLPDSFVWLGRGTALFAIPNAVILMILLYMAAYFIMSRTVLGRYIYAVGGNPEAARLSGVRVNRILLFVYTISGIVAGIGGIVLASQLKSGAPTYGVMYELYVIAAVVVGGTSLAGGEGKIMGTLIGALIIGVIQNGMNLTGVESYTQKVVLGGVILGAVLLDKLRNR